MILSMSEENEIHLNSQIERHFKLLKNATYTVGSLFMICLVPLVTFLWSIKSDQIKMKVEMEKDMIKQEEVYDNFVNKGQYIYLEGERLKSEQYIKLGADPAKVMSEWGKQVKDALDIKYRGMRNEK